MSWVQQTIAEFGRSIGIPNLAFNDRGLIQLAFESGAVLCLETVEEDILVYLSVEVPALTTDLKLRVLSLCHYKRQWPFPVQAGLRDANHLVFLVRLPERTLSLATLNQAIDLLWRLHSMARG